MTAAWAKPLVGLVAASAMLFGCGAPAPRPRPTVPSGMEEIYVSLSSGNVKVADEIVRDDWDLGPRSPVAHLPPPLSWTEDPYNDHYWKFIFYSLRPLSHLVYAYYTTGKTQYRDKLLQLLQGYTDYDSIRTPNGDTFDYRHAAAFRAMMLVNVYQKLVRSGDMPADLQPKLRASINKVADFLFDPYNFESRDNHAFNEAAGLLVVGANFPDMPNAPLWQQAALDRLNFEINNTVDPDGVEVENSPFYHFYVMSAVMQDIEWATLHAVPIDPGFAQRVDAMLSYATLIPQPDGRLPLLGSTVTFNLRSLNPSVYNEDDIHALPNGLTSDPAFTFIRTAGKSGTPPASRNIVFESSGQGILRSAFGSADDFGDQTHVTFNTGRWRNNHTHHDTLGVNLFASGRVLVSDSGLDTYDPGPEHDYFWGTSAHNTVTVDGQDQGSDPALAVKTGIVATGADPDTWAYQSGSHGLYGGVTHARSVVLLEKGLVLVVDALNSAASHDYVQTWHFGSGITADTTGPDVLGRGEDQTPLVLVHQALTDGITFQAVQAQDNPLQGYLSLKYHDKEANWALEYKVSSPSASFVTLFAAGAFASVAPSVAGQVGSGNAHAVVCAGSAEYEVTITNQASDGETVTVSHGGGCP